MIKTIGWNYEELYPNFLTFNQSTSALIFDNQASNDTFLELVSNPAYFFSVYIRSPDDILGNEKIYDFTVGLTSEKNVTMNVESKFDNKSDELRVFELTFSNNTFQINETEFTTNPLKFIKVVAYRKDDFEGTTKVEFDAS